MIYNPNKELIPFHPKKHWYYSDSQCRDNEKFILKLKRYKVYYLSAVIPNGWSDVKLKVFTIGGSQLPGDYYFQNVQVFFDHATSTTFVTFEINTESMPTGVYYITLSEPKFPNDVLYCEPFCVTSKFSNRTTGVNGFDLRWAHKCLKVGNVLYPTPSDPEAAFAFRKIHFQGLTIVLSDTQISESVVEDAFGNETSVSQMIIQKYMFSAVLPFYLIEALTTLPLHSEIYIDEWYGVTKKISKIEVIPEPEDFGCAGKVTIRFETNRVVKSGCCEESVTEKIDYNPNHYDEDDYSTT